MKPIVTIASICVILLFIYFATCVYTVGKAFSGTKAVTDKVYTESDYSCGMAIDTSLMDYSDDSLFVSITDLIIKGENSKGISIHFVYSKADYLTMVIKSTDYYCIDKGERVYMTFEDGTITKFTTYSGDCDYRYVILLEYDKSRDDIYKLRDKPIKSIRIIHDKEESEFAFSIDDQKHFAQVIGCFSI